MTRGKIQAESWLSMAAAAAIPLALGVYWPIYPINPEPITMALRVIITGAVAAMVIAWFNAPVTRAEGRFGGLFAVLLILLIVPSLTATDPIRALHDLAKLVLICVIGFGMARALRDVRTAQVFGYAMLAGTFMLTGMIFYVYVKHMGFSLPTYLELRQMKGMLAKKEGISLNPIAFSAIFMYIIGLCLVRPAMWIGGLGAFVFATAAFLTGSRAPAGILLVSATVLLVLYLKRARPLSLKVAGWSLALGLTLVLAILMTTMSAREFASLTEGRSILWRVAWKKFTEQPLVGYGMESWRDDLISRIPGEYALTSNIAAQSAGGYHNQYVTLLAEGGLLIFLPALAIIWWLVRSSHWIAFQSSELPINRYMILLGCLFLLLRAGVEIPGLFGYAQEPADYLAYCFLAVVISRLSLHEDRRRMAARAQTFLSRDPAFSFDLPERSGSWTKGDRQIPSPGRV
jgi:O-antigen ligase